ncbi:hypothetical protein D3C85_1068760 [compost metagenome]
MVQADLIIGIGIVAPVVIIQTTAFSTDPEIVPLIFDNGADNVTADAGPQFAVFISMKCGRKGVDNINASIKSSNPDAVVPVLKDAVYGIMTQAFF